MPEAKQKRLIVLVDPKIHKEIHLAAVEQETSVSEIVRELLRKYLDQFRTPERVSHELPVQG